jgi:ABC-2 type transport system ATP-binding protein
MTSALVMRGVGKRYRRRWALRDCTLDIPAGRVVGLVGANGAGKTTLLHVAVGLLAPTAGTVVVFGDAPASSPEQLARVGFLAQDAPVYRALSVEDHLRLGRRLNQEWDDRLARERLAGLGLGLDQPAGNLSGGQRAQLALTLAVAKRPQLLVLDEPVASLDPLARREYLQGLMEAVADDDLTVVLSSHVLADVERVCDHVVVVSAGEVQLAGDIDDLLASHRVLTGPREELGALAATHDVVRTDVAGRHATMLIRTDGFRHDPAWSMAGVGLEELVLAYMAPKRLAEAS